MAEATSESLQFELGEELRRQRDDGATVDYGALAERFGVSVRQVEDCMAALVALEQALTAVLEPLPDAEDDPLPPPVLPPTYQVLGELGRGGMGVVYRARQQDLDRSVAVKVLRPEDLRYGDLLRRFEREARALARLRHPHVVSVHEVGQSDGHVFFSMDLIEGASLAELLSREALNPARAVRVLRQVTSAIAYCHGQGLLHRDLKPGNVLLDEAGDAYVVDFGLACELDGADGLTATGQVLGTPAYMSPEQARGERAAVGEASDVYALGAILYECLTGRRPFARRSLAETLHAVIHDEPAPPRTLEPRVPIELEAVCLKALAKEPAERYPSAAALLEELERFEQGRPVLARRPGRLARSAAWARRRPAVAALVAQGVLALAVGAGWVAVEARSAHRQRAERQAEDRREFARSQREIRRQLAVLNAKETKTADEQAWIGWALTVGWGGERDVPRALDLLLDAAEGGSWAAASNLLSVLLEGQRLEPELVFDARNNDVNGFVRYDRRSLDVRDPDLGARVHARLEQACRSGAGWALAVDAGLAAAEREEPRLLSEDELTQRLERIVRAATRIPFAAGWPSEDSGYDAGQGGAGIGGAGPGRTILDPAVRNPRWMLGWLLARQNYLRRGELAGEGAYRTALAPSLAAAVDGLLDRLTAASREGNVRATQTLVNLVLAPGSGGCRAVVEHLRGRSGALGDLLFRAAEQDVPRLAVTVSLRLEPAELAELQPKLERLASTGNRAAARALRVVEGR